MSDEDENNEISPAGKDGEKGGAGKNITYLMLKIAIFIFIVISMGMCSIKFMS